MVASGSSGDGHAFTKISGWVDRDLGPEVLVEVRDMAMRLALTSEKVYAEIRAGRLLSRRVGSRVFVLQGSLIEYKRRLVPYEL
jgi:hypothetical protein